MKKILVCEKCGGTEIQILAWVDANTNEYKEDNGFIINDDNRWCEVCSEHVGFNLVEVED